jgi:hypothetical protein
MSQARPTPKNFRLLVLGFVLVSVVVGGIAGPTWAFQMALAFPAVLWIVRLVRAAGSGIITRRLMSWSYYGRQLRRNRLKMVRRSEQPTVFWSCMLREAMFCALLSAFLLMPLVRSLLA